MVVVQLEEDQFDRLKRQLQGGSAESNWILGAITNVREGRLNARFYVDDWPVVSAVVCQVLHPRISDVADLICYAKTSEALLKVLKEGDLITWGKRQTLEQVDRRHALYLMENLKPPPLYQLEGCSSAFKSVFEGNLYYLPEHVPLGPCNVKCAHGLSIQPLKAEHGTVIASNWGGKRTFQSWPNFTSFFEGLRENFESVGVYVDDDNGTDGLPVAAATQFACGRIGNLFTSEAYRQQGLGTLMMKILAQQTRNGGLIPECNIGFGNPNVKLVSKLGFVQCEDYKPNRLIVVSAHDQF